MSIFFKKRLFVFFFILLLIIQRDMNAQTDVWQSSYTFISDSLMTPQKYEEAYKQSVKNLETAQTLFGKKEKQYIDNILQLGEIQYFRKNYADVIHTLTTYLPTFKISTYANTTYYAQIQNLMGIAYRRLNQLDKAENAYRESLIFLSKIAQTKTSEYNEALNNLATVYQIIGRIDEAINMATQSLAFTPKNANKLANLAFLYKRKGRFKEALAMAHEALLNTPKTDKYYVDRLSILALIYTDIRFSEKAISYTQQALEIVTATMGKNAPKYALFENNLASFYNDAQEYHKALPFAEESVKLEEPRKAASDNYYFYTAVLAKTYCHLSRLDEALPLAIEAVKQTAIKPGKTSWHYFHALQVLALIYEKKGDIHKAIDYYQTFVDAAKSVWSPTEDKYIATVKHLIPLYNSQNQRDKSTALLIELAESMNTQVVYHLDILDEYSKELFIQTFVKDYEPLLFSQLMGNQKQSQQDSLLLKYAYEAELAIKGVVLSSSQLFRQMSQRVKNKNNMGHPDSIGTEGVENMKLWTLLREKISKAYTQKENESHIDSLKNQLAAVEEQLIALMPEMRLMNRKTVRFDDIRRHLPPDACAIEFVHFKYFNNQSETDTVIYAALIAYPHKAVPDFVYLCTEKELTAHIKQYDLYALQRGQKQSLKKNAVKSSNNQLMAEMTEGARVLYNLIWRPLQPIITDSSIKTIYYTPSGLLHRVAFPALQIDTTRLLFDKYNLYPLSSTREILDVNTKNTFFQQTDTSTCITLWGGIEYDDENPKNRPNKGKNDRNAWVYLEGTKKEIKRISAIFSKKNKSFQLKEGWLATEDNFKNLNNQPTKPPILHIATHGFFYQNTTDTSDNLSIFQTAHNPLIRSGLVMANANRVWLGGQPQNGKDDGILTAYEISNLDLSTTQLAVLSACETGLGDIQGTEGVYGLQRAFKMAGVTYILMSLWQVPDVQTATLMESFYTNLLSQMPIQEAFAQAQKKLAKKYPPYYWAGFVLMR